MPIITAAGLLLAYMLAGAVLVEVTFALPGIGSLLVDSVERQGHADRAGDSRMLIAIMVVVVNLLADIVYVAVDPRISFGRSKA